MRLLLIDDQRIFLEGMRKLLCAIAELQESDFDLAVDLAETGQHLAVNAYDLVLLDWDLGNDVTGETSLDFLREHGCMAPIVVLSGFPADEKAVERALDLGASSYLSKQYGSQVLVPALNKVLGGQIFLPLEAEPQQSELAKKRRSTSYDVRIAELTPSEHAVYMAATRGLSNKLIAREMGIEPSTVKTHLSRVYSKLCVSNRTEAAYEFSREGRRLISP